MPLQILAEEISIDDRLIELKERYLNKALDYENPIIAELYEDFKNYSNGGILKIKTPLCHFHKNKSSLAQEADQAQAEFPADGNDFYSSYTAQAGLIEETADQAQAEFPAGDSNGIDDFYSSYNS